MPGRRFLVGEVEDGNGVRSSRVPQQSSALSVVLGCLRDLSDRWVPSSVALFARALAHRQGGDLTYAHKAFILTLPLHATTVGDPADRSPGAATRPSLRQGRVG